MCGIAGIICPDPHERIDRALLSIEHRGRDDQGVYISEPFSSEQVRTALGHRRLSIIDPTPAGHQPMSTEDGRYWLTFNGEIYNYLEVRAELESGGEVFKTGTDTEVLIKAFRRWDVGCLDRLNGMFAFAVWDDRDRELTLVRDRAGIKPLFYSLIRSGIVFGSEIKSILATGLVRANLSLQGLDQTLTFLWPVPPHTLFDGISQLMPGQYLKWRDGKAALHNWWDLDLSVKEPLQDERDWSELVFDTLDRVTKMEMVADVPVGAFLSGGIDSSALVALMSRHSERQISTYTTGISAEDLKLDIIPDDVEWSRRVAEILPIDYHETVLRPDLIDLLPKLVRHQEAPIIDMAIPSFLISAQARSTQKVMLSGMGGDEVFAGYPRHLAMKVARFCDVVPTTIRRPALKVIESSMFGGIPGRLTAPMRNLKKFARSGSLDFEERYLGFGTYFSADVKKTMFTGELRHQTDEFDAYGYHRELFRRTAGLSDLDRILYVDFKTFMPALNLDTTDRTSMAANLEVRVPYLNKEMLDLASHIPAELKIKGFKRKYILKRAVEKLLPREVIWRKKAGFGAPVRSWLRGPLRPLVHDLLSETRVRSRGLFRPDAVKKLLETNLSGREDLNLQIFCLLTLELWMQEFLDK